MGIRQPRGNALQRFWNKLGPGLITGASDDDPSGIATYSQAGARFGPQLLWTAIVTYPLMVVVQEMCARIGMVTGHGLMGTIKRYYPRWLMYVILGILYESFIHPLTILSALPFAGFGALATLLLFKVELSLYAFVGVILLVGLVKKNGIMMVDFAIEQRRHGKSAEEAIFEACMVRFRPIMMTTMAAMLGALPLALGRGDGAELRTPLGIAIVGGLLLSQLLTLYTTPVVYLYLDRFRLWCQRVRTRSPTNSPEPQ